MRNRLAPANLFYLWIFASKGYLYLEDSAHVNISLPQECLDSDIKRFDWPMPFRLTHFRVRHLSLCLLEEVRVYAAKRC